MPSKAPIPHVLAALGLALPLLLAAQTSALMSDAERARRDAEKVFSFIKFQTVRERPAKAVPANRERPASPAPRAAAAPATSPSPTDRSTPAATASPAAVAELASPAPASSEPAALPSALIAPPALPSPAPVAMTPAASAAVTPPPAPEPEEDDEETALQLQSFVAPSLSPEVNATLGAGSRNVKVRFTVETDGRVSKAEAASGVPRRLAKPATDAILQWRFAPLAQARTVDVEIAFRRD